MQPGQERPNQHAHDADEPSDPLTDVEHALPCRASPVSVDSFSPIAGAAHEDTGEPDACRARLCGGEPVCLPIVVGCPFGHCPVRFAAVTQLHASAVPTTTSCRPGLDHAISRYWSWSKADCYRERKARPFRGGQRLSEDIPMQASSASDTHSPTPTPQVLRGRGPDQSKCAEHQPRSAAA